MVKVFGHTPPLDRAEAMVILLPLVAWEDSLRDFLPPLSTCRPVTCPGCGHGAHPPGQPLGIVGHGTYRRHVRGLQSSVEQTLIRVRRFLCRGCERTISVLPDLLHPRRWWSALAILWVLAQHLLRGRPERELREQLAVDVDGTSWRSPRRWRRQLLARLWPGWGRSLGCRDPAPDRAEGRRRLRLLLAQAGWEPARDPAEPLVQQLARGAL